MYQVGAIPRNVPSRYGLVKYMSNNGQFTRIDSVLYGLTQFSRCTAGLFCRCRLRLVLGCRSWLGHIWPTDWPVSVGVRQVCTEVRTVYGRSVRRDSVRIDSVRQVCTECVRQVTAVYGRSVRRCVRHGWPRSSRPRPTPEAVAEGPSGRIVWGDALARAPYSGQKPTGDQPTDPRRTLKWFVGRSPVGSSAPLTAHPGPEGQGITVNYGQPRPLRHCLRRCEVPLDLAPA